MQPLATIADVEGFVGRPLTPEETVKANAIIAKASALFRLEAGQTFTREKTTVRRKVNGGEVLLPMSPVVNVESVTDDWNREVKFRRTGQVLHVPMTSSDFVSVTYEHGADDVPELVRTTVAEIVKKVLTISPKAAAGLTQWGQTAGPLSEQQTYATWAQGGQTMLSPDDAAIARRFRVRGLNVWVQNAPAGRGSYGYRPI